MGFFDEITNLFGAEEIDKSFKIEVFGRTALSVSGYKKILTLGEGEISFKVGKGDVITITGAKLYIKKLEECEVVVSGVIMKISLEKGSGGAGNERG